MRFGGKQVDWGINSFDQWGVEFGKKLAMQLLPTVEGKEPATGRGSSTLGLVATIHQLQSM